MHRLTYRQTLKLAIPVMLAQAATATTGVVDTAVMAAHGAKASLAAVAIASVVFSFVYWAFGFLRMSTTGLTAQALGAGDSAEAAAVLQRTLVTGAILGSGILCVSPGLRALMLWFYPVDATVSVSIEAYFDSRIWGAPALLTSYGITGWLLGTGRTRQLLAFQVVVNGVNAGLDMYFVTTLDLGAQGIGLGTAIAEWVSLVFGLCLVRPGLKNAAPLWTRARLAALWSANIDIMIRTLALLFAFGWFVRSGALISTAVTAGNEVLLQFIAVAAFILDGYAFIAEKEAGEAYGAGVRQRLLDAIRVTSLLAIGSAAVTSAVYFAAGDSIISAFVADPEAMAVALEYLPYCAAVPVIGVFAYQLDGIFLGTTQGAAMRNASVMSSALYLVTDTVLSEQFGNDGIWTAFLLFYLYRAALLAGYIPRLLARLERRAMIGA